MSYLPPRECYEVEPPKTVKNFDLEAYLGTWYEVARIPNVFEPVHDDAIVVAKYSMFSSHKLQLYNKAYHALPKMEVTGTADVDPKNPSSKLEVEFFGLSSTGHYWILELGKKNKQGLYSYAIVGDPHRRHLWILYRKPNIPDKLYEKLYARVRDVHGYDERRLVKAIPLD